MIKAVYFIIYISSAFENLKKMYPPAGHIYGDLWNTPQELFDDLSKLFGPFDFDPCPENPTFDGLEVEWKDNNFVNPPYSNIKLFLEKAIIEQQKNKNSTFLLPLRTTPEYFRNLILKHASGIYFLNRRVKFISQKEKKTYTTAPFDSIVVHFCGYKNDKINYP